nr:GNAT family N-acetyltransferase [Allomuricauda sp.]
MEIIIKTFSELTKKELYEILRLRNEVFVVEQNCAYQDLDDKDDKALHVLGQNEASIIAYARIFKPGDYFDNAAIGRVVVAKEGRKLGYGKQIMEATISEVNQRFPNSTIELSAQTYLKKFYSDLGFSSHGSEYLEDGIPHVRMIK